MILQNKQTGVLGVLEATTYHGGRPDNIVEVCEMGMGAVRVLAQYKTLEELLGEWKDYKPAEPLIKDEKIRKAVRAWAEACNLKHVTYKQASNEFYDADTRGAFAIRFTLMPVEVYLEDGEHYTIAELCGEEEE